MPIEKLKRKFTKFVGDVKSTVAFYKQLNRFVEFELTESDLVKAQILSLLQKNWGGDHYTSLLATELSETIVNLIESNDKTLVMDRVTKHFGPLVELAVHKTGLLCGVAGLWELNLKFLAHKLDVDVFEERRNEVRTSNLSVVCEEINRRYPKIKVNFKFLADIRHCLFHGNFKQLRTMIETKLSAGEKESLKSKIVALHLGRQGNDRFTMSDDPMSNTHAIEMGPFFWFLSGGNSKLIDFAVREFEHGLAQIEKLIILHSVSFDDCAGVFDQLAITGQRLTTVQEDHLFRQFQTFAPHVAETKDACINRLYRSFDLAPQRQ